VGASGRTTARLVSSGVAGITLRRGETERPRDHAELWTRGLRLRGVRGIDEPGSPPSTEYRQADGGSAGRG